LHTSSCWLLLFPPFPFHAGWLFLPWDCPDSFCTSVMSQWFHLGRRILKSVQFRVMGLFHSSLLNPLLSRAPASVLSCILICSF
jgi:hypothetical protein